MGTFIECIVLVGHGNKHFRSEKRVSDILRPAGNVMGDSCKFSCIEFEFEHSLSPSSAVPMKFNFDFQFKLSFTNCSSVSYGSCADVFCTVLFYEPRQFALEIIRFKTMKIN